MRDRAIRYFQSRLSLWFEDHKRDFPWRRTKDPYKLLIAEVMLRRTRAEQVAPVYEEFTQRFPDAASLEEATDGAVAEVVHPLGLNWRAPHFKLIARQLMAAHGGAVPSTRGELMTLPGVGDYVADAIRCFGFGDSIAVVDTNTVRLAGRFLGFPFGPESRRNRSVIDAVQRLLDKRNPGESNMALLDFAASVCRAPTPDCNVCPMTRHCRWYLEISGHK